MPFPMHQSLGKLPSYAWEPTAFTAVASAKVVVFQS